MVSEPRRPEPGTRTPFRWRKWDGSPHWVNDGIYLGRDEWGDWFGQPTGWQSLRPGRVHTARGPGVTLMPPSGDYTLTVNAVPPATYRIYIDIAWDVRWSDADPAVPSVPGGIDMDLDVVRTEDERGTWIDDRDEWDEHRVAYGYPLDVVARLESLAADLEIRVRDRVPPFDGAVADNWMERLAALQAPEPKLEG